MQQIAWSVAWPFLNGISAFLCKKTKKVFPLFRFFRLTKSRLMGISATFTAFDVFLTWSGAHFPMTVLESAGLM
ncbi:MAG: hypothetical protein LBP99_04310 [Azoarcus sp.]|jgi:hypothetical protein|nr:hypothetical protein [Azoarcus sp.]